MKEKPGLLLEKCRIRNGPYASREADGNNGAFLVRAPGNVWLFIIASDMLGWEHVSVSPKTRARTPKWAEMCFVKDLFWDKGETVIQYHPAKSFYVNIYPYVLHLWRPCEKDIPLPPLEMV